MGAVARGSIRPSSRNQAAGTSRTSVICDINSGDIIGYVSLATAQIERAFLPKLAQRNRPDPVPAILLGQLASIVGIKGSATPAP